MVKTVPLLLLVVLCGFPTCGQRHAPSGRLARATRLTDLRHPRLPLRSSLATWLVLVSTFLDELGERWTDRAWPAGWRALVRNQNEGLVASSGLLFIDLDGFRHANERLGHDVGDRISQKVGAALGD